MIIQICVGSSCHLKGSPEIIELLEKAVADHHLETEVTLAGSFCIGKCNRIGVTVQVDDDPQRLFLKARLCRKNLSNGRSFLRRSV